MCLLQVYKTFDEQDSNDVEKIDSDDIIVAYQVDTAAVFHAPKRNKWNSEPYEPGLSCGIIVMQSQSSSRSIEKPLPSLFVLPLPSTNRQLYEALRDHLDLEDNDECIAKYHSGSSYSGYNSTQAAIPEDEAEFDTQEEQVVNLTVECPPSTPQDVDGSAPEDASSAQSLYDCLSRAQLPEQLTKDNAFYCSKCEELVEATKQMEVWNLPDMLIIHLKRFSYTKYSRDKLEDLIDFPIDDLDMSDHCLSKLGSPEDAFYDCIGISCHHGGLGGGHYTAYVRSIVDMEWYEVDDSHTSRVSDPSQLRTSAAYLLVYGRKSYIRKQGWIPQQTIGEGDDQMYTLGLTTSYSLTTQQDVIDCPIAFRQLLSLVIHELLLYH